MDLGFIFWTEEERRADEAHRKVWEAANPIEEISDKCTPPIIENLDLPPNYEVANRSYGFAIYSNFDMSRGGFPTDSKIGGYAYDEGEIASADAWEHYNNQNNK